MKLALLGLTSHALAFAREAIAAGHSVRDVFDPPDESLPLTTELPTLQLRSDWENLLHEREFDAVVIAGPLLGDTITGEVRQRREDQLRKLVQARVPLIVLPPVCEAILGFELEMIRSDVHGVIATYCPRGEHPVWRSPEAPATGWEQIVVERSLGLRSREEVQAALVNDLEILRRFLGPLRRVAASGGVLREKSRPDLSHLTVSVTGTNPSSVRWMVLPARESPETRFTFYEKNKSPVSILIPADGPWKLSGPQEETLPAINAAEVLLQELQRALRGEKNGATSWLDACRNVEAMEAVDRSLERGRTIELYNEELSEQSSFKGTMAVGGCLLLLVALFIFIATGVVSAVLGTKNSGVSWLGFQICLIVPFTGFLLLQLLSLGLNAHQQRKRGRVSKLPPAAKEDSSD